jgi:hypothetical protein
MQTSHVTPYIFSRSVPAFPIYFTNKPTPCFDDKAIYSTITLLFYLLSTTEQMLDIRFVCIKIHRHVFESCVDSTVVARTSSMSKTRILTQILLLLLITKSVESPSVRIVGGRPAHAADYPYQVTKTFSKRSKLECTTGVPQTLHQRRSLLRGQHNHP